MMRYLATALLAAVLGYSAAHVELAPVVESQRELTEWWQAPLLSMDGQPLSVSSVYGDETERMVERAVRVK